MAKRGCGPSKTVASEISEKMGVKSRLPATKKELNKIKDSSKEEKTEQRKNSKQSEIQSESLIFSEREYPKEKAMTKSFVSCVKFNCLWRRESGKANRLPKCAYLLCCSSQHMAHQQVEEESATHLEEFLTIALQ